MRLLLFSCLVVFQGFVVSGETITDELHRVNSTQEDEKSIITTIILESILKIYAPTSSLNEECKAHSLQYVEGVEHFKMWALKMFDSSTKIPDGIMAGMIKQLGNFDECVGVVAPDEGNGVFTGQHCYVRLQPELAGRVLNTSSQPPVGIPDYLARLDSAYRNQNKSQLVKSGIPLPQGVGYHWSFCVPSSCSVEDVSAHFSQALGFLGVKALIGEGDCNTKEGPPLAVLDWVVISLIIVLVLIAALSTAYDLLASDSEPRRPVLLAFSLYTNGQRLFDISSTGSETLHALSGIRFLSISWVVYCHTWVMSAVFPTISIPFFFEFMGDHSREYLVNGTLSVDSFFLLSGTLLCYVFLKEMEKGTSFNVPLFYLHRYIRLTPPVVAMILFHVSFADKLGSGPVWSVFEFFSTTCRSNWWVNLLYVQNYVNYHQICLPQTWYLAADMQLFLLSPLILYPLWKWPKIGQVVLFVAFTAGLSSSYTTHYLKRSHKEGFEDDPWTHTRNSVWLVGIALGFILHHRKNRRPQLNKIMVCALWALALFLTVGILYMPVTFTNSNYHYLRGVDALWLALFRPLFGLGLAIIIFCCVHGYGGFVNSFLSWKVFTPLARLSYCIYLTHVSVQVGLLAVMKTHREFTDSVLVPRFFSDMVISTGFAVLLALLVEIPFINVERSLFRKGPTIKVDKGIEMDQQQFS